MTFEINILNEKPHEVCKIIDVKHFDVRYIKDIAGINEDAIWEYNDLFFEDYC